MQKGIKRKVWCRAQSIKGAPLPEAALICYHLSTVSIISTLPSTPVTQLHDQSHRGPHHVDAVGKLGQGFIGDVVRRIAVGIGEVQLLVALAEPPLGLAQVAPAGGVWSLLSVRRQCLVRTESRTNQRCGHLQIQHFQRGLLTLSRIDSGKD